MKSVDQAIHDTVHDWKKRTGREICQLAAQVNISEGRLYNQTNIKQENHIANINTIRALILATEDTQILESMAYEAGKIVSCQPDYEDLSDLALLDVILHANKEHGDVSQAINSALDNGEISRNESLEIESEIMEAVSVLMGLRDKIKSMVIE